ncbi:MAG: hypothetical protein Q7T18_04305 [Sedimentisphaerales bacterium]|nr:hypothetical protein [Sedimentisphaerales bacterium]
MCSSRVLLIVLGALLSCGGLAQAVPITIAISGYVTSVNDMYSNLDGKINVGDSITGTYTFDTAISELSVYNYYALPAGVSLDIGTFHFQTDPANVWVTLGVINNDSAGEDWYSVYSHNNLPLSDGTRVVDIVFGLRDPTGTALSSDAFPLIAPDLSKWGNALTIDIARGGTHTIRGLITSAVLVPEPCSVLLLITGLSLIRRQRNR